MLFASLCPATRADLTLGPDAFDTKMLREAKKTLGKADKVILAGFRVAFNTTNEAHASTDSRLKNLGNSGASPLGLKTVTSSAAVSLRMMLGGLTPAQLQQITEEIYADFKGQLARTGIQVLGPDALKSTQGYRDIKFAGIAPGHALIREMGVGDARTFAVLAPAELPLFFTHFETVGIGNAGLDLGNWRALNGVSVETKAVVLVPTIVVDFVRMSSSGNNKLLRDTAEVGGTPVLHLVAGQGFTTIKVYHAKIRLAGDSGDIGLARDVDAPGAFGEVRQVSASDNAALNTALVLLTGQAGRVNSKSVRVLQADPAAYTAKCLELGHAVNTAFVAALAAK
jgi:hypothetical protein